MIHSSSWHQDSLKPMSEMETQFQFQVQKSRSFLKDRLNNSTLRWSQIQLATKAWSTSKSSQILSVLIQTWITRVLYTQERSSISLGQNSSSFKKRNGEQKFCSTLEVSSNTSAEYIVGITKQTYNVMQKRQIKKYVIQTNCSNRCRAGVPGHLSQMKLGTNQSRQ